MRNSFCLSILAALLVSACGNDTASYMVDGKSDNAFSMFRNKAYPGASWEVALVLTHLPDCQRRHPLKSVASDKPFEAELFLDAEGDYLLHAGDHWYQAQLAGCTLHEVASVPATPGSPVGVWKEGEGGFRFSSAGKP